MESGYEPRQAYNPADFTLSVAPMMDWLYAGVLLFPIKGLVPGRIGV